MTYPETTDTDIKENVYFEAENASGQSIDVSIDTDWTEIPLSEVPELQ